MGMLPVLLICACFFESETHPKPPDSIQIRPDLSIGNQWMYQYRRYTEYADGSKSDSNGYFIHYEITGDTLIAGIRYRVLVEEDLALINTDIGLTRYRSAYVVRADSTGVRVKALKGSGRATGRLPFKISSDATKIILGGDTLLSAGAKVPALKFQVEVENADDVRIYEWYIGNLKVFSRASASTTYAGRDTSRAEEEYLGERAFTREDTLAVLNDAN